jgi:hypothetical protein
MRFFAFIPESVEQKLSGRSSDLSRFKEAFPSTELQTVAGIS